MTVVSDLSPNDQVSYWIGRVVRKEAEIESTLRVIHHSLTGGLAWVVLPTMPSPLQRQVRDMLKELNPETGYLTDCLAALDALSVAHETRNRIVHDWWVESTEHPPGKLVRAAKGISYHQEPEVTRGYEEFEQCFQDLNFAGVRVAGIMWTVERYVPNSSFVWGDMLDSNREAIAGRIKMTSENSWEFTDPVAIARLRKRFEGHQLEFKSRHRFTRANQSRD